MPVLELICYLLAFTAFAVAALSVPAGRVNLIAAGLALAIFPTLVEAVHAVS